MKKLLLPVMMIFPLILISKEYQNFKGETLKIEFNKNNIDITLKNKKYSDLKKVLSSSEEIYLKDDIEINLKNNTLYFFKDGELIDSYKEIENKGMISSIYTSNEINLKYASKDKKILEVNISDEFCDVILNEKEYKNLRRKEDVSGEKYSNDEIEIDLKGNKAYVYKNNKLVDEFNLFSKRQMSVKREIHKNK